MLIHTRRNRSELIIASAQQHYFLFTIIHGTEKEVPFFFNINFDSVIYLE